MALACGQKRPRLSAGKALGADVEALPSSGRLSKVAARFGTWKKPGALRGSCGYKSRHPALCDRWHAHWQNLRDPDGNDWDADCPASGVRRAYALTLLSGDGYSLSGRAGGKILVLLSYFRIR